MPLLKREPFVRQKPAPDLNPDDEVFHCKITDEIFVDYEQFFERMILCNSLVWTCSLTGKTNLTYQEAVESEEKAKRQLSSLPESLQKPLLFLANKTARTRLVDVNEDIFSYARERYFVNELVEVTFSDAKKTCRIIRVVPNLHSPKKTPSTPKLPSTENSDDDVICLDDPQDAKPKTPTKDPAFSKDPTKFKYVVQEPKKNNTHTVKALQISRRKGVYTRDKSKLYLKMHCHTGPDGYWKVKERFIKKFKLTDINYSDFFDGPLPDFQTSVVKRKPKGSKVIDVSASGKKKRGRPKKGEDTLPKVTPMPDDAKWAKMSAEEKSALKEKIKEEKLARKEELKKLWEQEKARRKEERDQERVKKQEEKKQREEYLKEFNKPREDMECNDLKDMPVPKDVQLSILNEYFGELVHVIEFLNCFSSLFDVHEAFPEGITVDNLSRALIETEMNGLYYDILRFLLLAIFNLQVEEEEEEKELSEANTNIKERQKALTQDVLDGKDATSKDFMQAATAASMWSQLSYSCPLNKLQMDPFTITEIIRLHIVSSGAEASEENLRFRYQQRGGYTSLDDAGLEFRRQEPQLVKDLFHVTVFDLSPEDKLKILGALVNQLLTFMACRDFIEDNYDKIRQIRHELKLVQATELRREKDETAFWHRKRMEDKAKEREAEAERKEKKKKDREERVKIDEIRKRAKAEKKDLRALLVEEGHTDLVTRLDEDTKIAAEEEEKTKAAEKEKEEDDLKLPSERRSARQFQKKVDVKKKMLELEDIPLENIEWDKVTAEEKAEWKAVYQAKEEEFLETIQEMIHSYAVTPIGRDRTFRRYWVFQSIPGLFVENFEEFLPEDYFKPVEQIQGNKTFHSQHLPLESTGLNESAEGKSTSSDKENIDLTGESANEKDSNSIDLRENGAMEVDEKPKLDTINVHDQVDQFNSLRWSFFHTQQQLDALIESLNPRGVREGPLRSALIQQKRLLKQNLQQCPVEVLHVSADEQNSRKNAKFQKVKSRSRQGVVKGDSAEELLELNLREMLLDIEDRMYAGSLAILKIKNREAWRDAIEQGSYDPQCDNLYWGDKSMDVKKDHTKDDESMEVDQEPDEKAKPSRGQVVSDLAKALLQIEQGIDQKYLSPPLGEDEDTKKAKHQTALEAAFKKLTPKKKKDNANGDESDDESPPEFKSSKERWEEALMAATNLSQLFLHLAVLEKSITWGKSTLNARCRICRRKGDAEKMLLCDGCDRGHHMYCLKPQVKKIPEGDWFCPDCRPKDIMRTPRKARRQSSLRDVNDSSDEEEKEEEEEGEEEAGSDEEEDSDGEEDSDEDDDEDEDEDNDEEEGEEEEEENESEEDGNEEEDENSPVPTKVKLGVRGKKRASSGRSTPNIPSGRSSRNATPRENTPEDSRPGSRARQRLVMKSEKKEKSAEKSRKSTESGTARSRASLETGTRSRSTSRAASRNASRASSPAQNTKGGKVTPRGGAANSKITPKGGSAKGGSSKKATPKGAAQTAPKGRAQERTSSDRSRKRKATSDEEEDDDEPPSKAGKIRGGEDGAQMKQCEDLVISLMKDSDSWPFIKPVTRRDAPDYFQIIKKPMDFSTIKAKINRFEYVRGTDILEDLRLIFTNCERYNETNTDEYAAGQRLCRLFVRKVKESKLDALLAAKALQNGGSPAAKSTNRRISQGKAAGAAAAAKETATASNPRHTRRNSRRST